MTKPLPRFADQLLDKARGVRVFFLDVDGVMTDGSLYFDASGEALKKFNALDGHGLKLLKQSGIVPVLITGRDSSALRARVKELQLNHVFYGVENKQSTAQQCLQVLGLSWAEAAAMGDDWPDLPVLLKVALAVVPATAHLELLTRADHVCMAAAGMGAVREACDLLLMANGAYSKALNEVLN
jgi:3-deoxy-D-manno-octulosonate 8-phosphate phosphatase (KDO 8-P phosphatase)